jgi:transposase
MFGLGPATKIYLGAEPVDMRKGFEGLFGLVRDQFGHDPLSGHLFLFTPSIAPDRGGRWCGTAADCGCARSRARAFHWPKGTTEARTVSMRPKNWPC